jgi:outer membrane protein OmpA-like peptidoglycan-associated protein
MKLLICTALVLASGIAAADQGTNCQLGTQYLMLAKARITASAHDEAVSFLQHSMDSCPSYEASELLGEVLADSPDVAEEKRAAESFVNAYPLAGSDTQRAHTLYEYAKLLDSRGDAQNASPLIIRARILNSSDEPIRALAAQIDTEVQNPTTEGIVRGLKGSVYVHLNLSVVGMAAAASAATAHPQNEVTGPSVAIPITFETNSTIVDAATRNNIVKLSEALKDPGFQNRHFVFVGHADVRGTESHNVSLSKDRAEAIYQTLLARDPTLQGRVEVIGRGSADPLDPASTTEAFSRNRRLQVLLK